MRISKGLHYHKRVFFTPDESLRVQAFIKSVGSRKKAAALLAMGESTLESAINEGPALPATRDRLLGKIAEASAAA